MANDLNELVVELKETLAEELQNYVMRKDYVGLSDEQKIKKWLDEIGCEIELISVEDGDVNDFVKNEWKIYQIEVDKWNVETLCELYNAKVFGKDDLDTELEDADE